MGGIMNGIGGITLAFFAVFFGGSGCYPELESPCDTNNNGRLDSADDPFQEDRRIWLRIEENYPFAADNGIGLTELDSISALNLRNEDGTFPLSDISFIGCFPQLARVDLAYQDQIADYSPLRELENLEVLSLLGSNARPEDVAELTNLKVLSAAYCGWETLEPLSGLTNLEKLHLRQNGSREHPLDLTGLELLQENLTRIDLRCNGLVAIGPLRDNPRLRQGSLSLDLSGNPDLSDEEVSYLKSFEPFNGGLTVAHRRLNCAANPEGRLNVCDTNGDGLITMSDGVIADAEFYGQMQAETRGTGGISLAGTAGLREVSLSGIRDLTGFECFPYIYDLQISDAPGLDLAALSGNEALASLSLRSSPAVRGIEVLATLPNIDTLRFHNNTFSDAYFEPIMNNPYISNRHLVVEIFGNPAISCDMIDRLAETGIDVRNEYCRTDCDSDGDGYLDWSDGQMSTAFYDAVITHIRNNEETPERIVWPPNGDYPSLDTRRGIPVELVSRLVSIDARGLVIDSVTGIACFSSLQQLYISDSPGVDLTDLAGNRNLAIMLIEDSPGIEIAALANLAGLRHVELKRCDLTDADLEPLVRNSDFADGDELSLRGNPQIFAGPHPNLDALLARGVYLYR